MISPLLILVAILTAIAVVPVWHLPIKSFFQQDERKILSIIEGDVIGSKKNQKIIKIKTEINIRIEVYELSEPRVYQMIASLTLPESRDGYFQLKGSLTNFALMDIDKDGRSEILLSTYDDNLVPRFYALRFNSETKQLEILDKNKIKISDL